MSQFGQRSTRPHAKQWICVEKPRRLRKRSAWPPSASVVAERAREDAGQDELPPPRQRRALLREVDELDRRQRAPADPVREDEAPELAAVGGGARLERRRRGAQHERAARRARAPRGERARVVAEAFLVLVGAVVLLVEHDHAQVVERREEGGARADRDRRRAEAQALPLRDALGGAEPAVQDGELVAEARAQAADDLVRERDLGDEHERLPAARERALDRAQVDLRLAAAGDAVQEEAARLARVDRGGELGAGRGLLRGERRRRRVAFGQLALGPRHALARALRGLAREALDEAFLGERVDRGGLEACTAQHRLGARALPKALEERRHLGARRAGAQCLAPARGERDGARELREGARRERRREREPDRAQDFRRLLP